jgi:hypothetical protein
MKTRLPRFLCSSAILAAVVLVVAGPVDASGLRIPQVPFLYLPLQNDLNLMDGGINVATDQLSAQTWTPDGRYAYLFFLPNSLGSRVSFGLYNANQPVGATPTLFQVLPAGSAAGCWAQTNLDYHGKMFVTWFNRQGFLLGQTTFTGVDTDSLGFYIQNTSVPFIWFSQDARNGPGPQMLTFNSDLEPGDAWFCWEEAPFSFNSTFTQIVSFQPIEILPTEPVTWGRVKASYRK